MMRETTLVLSVCVLLGLTGCAAPVTPPQPETTSDAVRKLVVSLAGQCKVATDQKGVDFKACLNEQINVAVDEIRRGQKCVSLEGCRPTPLQNP
jgi:hypothetical protein